MSAKLVIVIPAFNEQKMVGCVVADVLKQLEGPELSGFDAEVVVVDDGSADRTQEEARRAGAIVLRHPVNCGLGAALATGFELALERVASVVVTLDSDGQHKAADIKRVIAPIVRGEADVAIGSRLLNRAGMPLDRRLINWGANVLTWLLFGVWTSDSQSGFRALSRNAVEQIELHTNRMEVSSEIIAEVGRLGLRLTEVPIEALYSSYSRAKGQSNSNSFAIVLGLLLRRLQ